MGITSAALDRIKPSPTIAMTGRVIELKAKGVAFESDPEDMSYLWRVARLRDPAGNLIALYHAGKNRLNPPWRVKV